MAQLANSVYQRTASHRRGSLTRRATRWPNSDQWSDWVSGSSWQFEGSTARRPTGHPAGRCRQRGGKLRYKDLHARGARGFGSRLACKINSMNVIETLAESVPAAWRASARSRSHAESKEW